MANTIILRRSAQPGKVPGAEQLQLGEIAINTYDGRVFIKKDDGLPSVIEVGGVNSVNALTGDVTLTTDNIAEGAKKYYTDYLARHAVTFVAGRGAYNAATGVITIPTDTGQLLNSANYATISEVSAAVSALVNDAPLALDTLKEIADFLQTDATGLASLVTVVDAKLDTALYTAADVLVKIKTVDGAGSGLDADLLDGQQGSFYATAAGLLAEATTRSDADATNAAAISAEEAARIAAVSAEEAARIAAISAEASTRSTAISTEIGARITGDANTLSGANSYTDSQISATLATLSSNVGTASAESNDYTDTKIATEAFARISGDATITAAITAEETARITADSVLTTNLAAEATTRAAADTTLTTNLAAEVTARTSGDATNAAAITTETNRATAAEGVLTTNLTAEVTRATAAEALLAPKASPTFTGTVSGITKSMVGLGLVDNTSDASKPVSTAQAAAIAVETTRATAAEGVLTSDLAAEAVTRANADSALSSLIDTKFTTNKVFALTGDVAGTITTDLNNNSISIATTIQPNSVALGADTTGNYVAGATAGTGVTVTGTAGEGWSPTISIGQSVATTASPTFAGLTLTGGVGITGSIIPGADITYDLGSPTMQWKDIYVGPGSLYVNGTKVLQDDTGTITFSADIDQNIRVTTLGSGVLQLGSSTTNINVDGTLQIASGKNITDSAGIKVNFGDNIEMNNNRVIGVGTPVATTDAATKGYVDTAISAVSTSSISQGNSSVAVVDNGNGSVNVTIDGSTALSVTSTGVVVSGDFTVQGTTTTVNSNQLSVADNIITLNSDVTGSPTQNSGIEIERGDETNVSLRWNESLAKWQFTNDGAVYFPVAVSTTDLAEGTKLYYTDARTRSAVSADSASGVSYNSATGAFSLGSIPNSSLTNSSVTVNGSAVSLGGSISLTSDVITQGSTNKYFSNTLARAAVSAGTGISYNSTTGVITNTITQYTDALARAAIGVSGSLSYNSTTGVISYTTPTTIASLSNHSTTGLVEGTNLYYTDARARAAVAAGTGISYNSTTGVITNTITQYTDALAVSANSSAIATAKSEAIASAATDASSKVATEVTNRNTAISSAISSEVTARNAAITAGVVTSAGKWTTARTSTVALTGDVTGSGSASVDGSGNWTVSVAATNGDKGSSQNIFKNFTDGTTTAAADSNNDTFKFRGSNGVTVAVASDDATHGDSLLVSLSSVPNSSLANSSITINGTAVALGGTRTLSTTDIGEGTNLYFTNARARAAVSAGTGISYNSTTGVITNTITQYTDALAVAANASAIATAKSEAISAAASDATTKANAAQAAAIAAVTNGAGAAFDTLKEIQDAMATDAELSAAIAAITIGNGTQTVTAGSYLTGGGSFTANQTSASSVTLNVDATNLNTASKVVARDASGNFSAGTITATLSGNATTATTATSAGKWTTARTITLAGDLTGSVSIDGSANATLTATVAANSVALGTDTTGNYMVNVSAGTGVSVSHTQGEGSTATITNTDLGSSQNIFKNVAVSGQTTVVADSNNDTLTFAAGSGISIATNATTDTVTITNTGVSGVNGNTGGVTLSNFHSTAQTVTSAQSTTNTTGTVDFTFSELTGAVHYNVLLNRMILRPSEFSISGTTVTVAVGILATDDEIEVTGCKIT